MSSPISDVVSGALFEEMRMSVLANNIANVNTAGYKEDRVSFQMPSNGEDSDGSGANPLTSANPKESYLGHPVETYTNFSPGRIDHTGSPLDLAIDGNGFFSVQTPTGTQYTRGGTFTIDQEGLIVTQEGHPLLATSGPIRVSGGEIAVDGNGNLSVDGNQIATLDIVDFPENTSLLKKGNAYFVPAQEGVEGQRTDSANIMQGFVERSNVDAVRSMTDMIQVLRGYESYQKILQFLDDATTKAVNDIGRLT